MISAKPFFALALAVPCLVSPLYGEVDEHDDHGTLTISSETAAKSGLTFETAGSGVIENTLTLNGRLQFNEDRVAHLTARFPGVVREVNKRLGDRVQKDEVLATIESNFNLQRYKIAAPFDGTIVKKHASIGEYVEERADIFMLADLSELWADFYVFPQDFGAVKVGQSAAVAIGERQIAKDSKLSFISSVVDELTQAKFARCPVPNHDGALYPGQFVTGVIRLSKVEVPLAVKASAIQPLRSDIVIFTVVPSGVVKPVPVRAGRRSAEFTEILEGLEPGTRYLAGNTLILRAEVQKGEFAHEH